MWAAMCCLFTPAASSSARRTQPGLAASAEMVRALWLTGMARPRRRSRRAVVSGGWFTWRDLLLVELVALGLAGGGAGLVISHGLKPVFDAEELLGVGELLPGPGRRFFPELGVRVGVHGQFRLGCLPDHVGLQLVRGGRRQHSWDRGGTGDVAGEPLQELAGGGRRRRD